MGADKHEKEKQQRLETFTPLLHVTMDTPAWRRLSHGAKILYIALKRRYNRKNHNNGRIYLSQRQANAELRSGFAEIARWYRELQHYGFIEMVTPGTLGRDGKGLAPHWRLTELGLHKELPTKEFSRWDGQRFKNNRRRPREIQKPVAENHNGVLRETITPSLRKAITPKGRSVAENRNIASSDTVAENRNILSIPSSPPLPSDPSPVADCSEASASGAEPSSVAREREPIQISEALKR